MDVWSASNSKQLDMYLGNWPLPKHHPQNTHERSPETAALVILGRKAEHEWSVH